MKRTYNRLVAMAPLVAFSALAGCDDRSVEEVPRIETRRDAANAKFQAAMREFDSRMEKQAAAIAAIDPATKFPSDARNRVRFENLQANMAKMRPRWSQQHTPGLAPQDASTPPPGFCEILAPYVTANGLHIYWGVGMSATAGIGLTGTIGTDAVWDLYNAQYANYLYIGGNAGLGIGASVGAYSFGAFGNKPSVIDAWTGDFLSAGISVPVFGAISASVAGFASPDGSIVGAQAGLGLGVSLDLGGARDLLNEVLLGPSGSAATWAQWNAMTDAQYEFEDWIPWHDLALDTTSKSFTPVGPMAPALEWVLGPLNAAHFIQYGADPANDHADAGIDVATSITATMLSDGPAFVPLSVIPAAVAIAVGVARDYGIEDLAAACNLPEEGGGSEPNGCTWTNPLSVESSAGALTRTSGEGWTAGASSVEEISAGDGYVEFSTAEANKSKMAGLSHGDSDWGWQDIDYGIALQDNGVVEIYESGWYRGRFGSYAADDVFRVEVSGGQVRYRQNGVVFHSSPTPPIYPLVLDTSLYHEGATITNAFVESCAAGDTSCIRAEKWKNVGFARADVYSLTRTPGADWTAGASSVKEISAGDGYVQFYSPDANTSKMAGLSHGDSDRGWQDIDYAIMMRDNGALEIYEGGWYRGYFGSYTAGDIFRVEVASGQVRYRHNGVVFHSSPTAPTYPLLLDTSLYHGGASITGVSVRKCAAGNTECILPNMWKNVGFALADGNRLTRTPGSDWTAGASSVEEISAGDGYAEFSTDEAYTSKIAGLSHGDSDRGWQDIDYGIALQNNGAVEIYESGSYRGYFGSYTAGDIFRVEVASGQVRYRHNGTVFHSSPTPPTYPLVLDTSLYHGGATIINASVESCAAGDTSCMPVEMWKNVGFAMADGATLTRTPGSDWSAGASSVEEISAGDGYVEFSTAEANKSKIAGLNNGDANRGWQDIDYGIALLDNGNVEIYEGGWYQGIFGSYTPGDIFRVEVSGGQVSYRQNGVVFHASPTPPNYPLVLDTSLYHGGATITNAFINGNSTGCGTVTQAGYCNGSVLVWCDQGALTSYDCASDGRVCGYQNAEIGYNCLTPPGSGGFGYPVGDKTTSPAGGWSVVQVLGHYLNSADGFHGGHLAQDIGTTEAATANAPVYSVADGVVLYAGSNTSTYVNVVLIKHDRGDGQKICSFYGHLGTTTVTAGQTVHRGDQIATILDWNAHFGSPMSHLHYVLLSEELCDASDAANGALICGYDDTPGPSGITDVSNEPAVYTSIGDLCGDQNYPNAFYSPSQFIDAHHF